MEDREKRYNNRLFIIGGIFVVCFFGSFLLGRYPVYPATLVKVLLSRLFPIEVTWPSQVETVIFNVRLPRVLMAALIGAGLSFAGAAYQGIFKNPMVSPDVLGASSGAGFGAALGLFLSFGYGGVSLCAFIFGLSAVGIVCIVSSRVPYNQVLGLVLSGIMVSSLANAAVSFIKLVADPTNTLPVITYWLMGSLASIRQKDVFFAAPWILFGIIPIYLLRWRINILSLGDEEARSMGIHTGRLRLAVVLGATLITSASVSVSGLIGWVGLVVPHLARMLVGSDYRRLLPASLLLGGSFLLIVDNVARQITTSEIPIGILTAFVGAPFFLYLILKEGNRL